MPIVFTSPTGEQVTFFTADVPEKIPLGGTSTGSKQTLSDGSRIFTITGETPQDIRLRGTLRGKDPNGETPLAKIQRLDSMRQRRLPVVVTSHVGSLGTVTIEAVTYDIKQDTRVDYDVLLFREVAGSLARGARVAALGPPPSAQAAYRQVGAQHMANLARITGGTTALSSAQAAAVLWDKRRRAYVGAR